MSSLNPDEPLSPAPVQPGSVVAPFGTWTSPVTAQVVASSALRLGGVIVEADDVYFAKTQTAKSGRRPNDVVARLA